jgi:hypothetical protein
MTNVGFVNSFKHFHAKLPNANWAVSAKLRNGAIVVSCWAHNFRKTQDGKLTYTDRLDHWSGNIMGKNLLTEHLTWAFESKAPVHLVMATTKDRRLVDKGTARDLTNTFNPRDDLVGVVSNFDGNTYIIKFDHAPAKTKSTKPKAKAKTKAAPKQETPPGETQH